MDVREAARHSGVIPLEKLYSLLASLKRPDMNWVVASPNTNELWLQGDLISRIPYAVVSSNGEVKCTPLNVLILNNSCDLQPNRSDFVTVAPVFDFRKFTNAEVEKCGVEKSKNYLEDVKLNKIYEILWLPAFGEFPDGVIIYLDRLSAVSAKLYVDAVKEGRRLASLTQNGFYFYLLKLTKHFARAESREVVRTE